MKDTTPMAPTVIRLSITKEVRSGLDLAKKRYPTLSDPEILKLGLSKIVTDYEDSPASDNDKSEIRRSAARAVGAEYLSDSAEDLYTADSGSRVKFS
jgi:hypothetical protein